MCRRVSNTLAWVWVEKGRRTHEEKGTGSGWKIERVGGCCCVLHGQLRLSGCFKCNVQPEHNYTGTGILRDTEGSHCGGVWACKLPTECVRERVHEHEMSNTHVQSCKLWFNPCQYEIWLTGGLTYPMVQHWVTQRKACRKRRTGPSEPSDQWAASASHVYRSPDECKTRHHETHWDYSLSRFKAVMEALMQPIYLAAHVVNICKQTDSRGEKRMIVFKQPVPLKN